MQILKLLAKGHSYKAISASLDLTLGTIKQHVHLLLKKSECPNKAAAVNRLQRGELFSKKR
ncbi:MAG: hypothetical protein IPN29_14450 [Saprospiraceae bacterium]|nr:hypothetical protein [Saprospiraceae bacterium]